MLSRFHSPQSLVYLAVHYFADTSAVEAPCAGCEDNSCEIRKKGQHAKEIEEKMLSKYRSHSLFSTDFCDGFSADPVSHYSQDGQEYLYWQDMLICLQNMILSEVPAMKHPLLQAMLSISLKLHEHLFEGCHFISTADNLLGEMRDEFLKKFKEQRPKNSAHRLNSTSVERFSKFLKMLPVEDEDDANHESFKTLSLIFEDLKAKKGEKIDSVISNLECVCKKALDGLEHVIHNWRFRIPNETTSMRPPPTVRCFVDGPIRFSLKQELDAAGGEPYVAIIVPIKRTKFRAVPILMPDGNYSILATDALFHVIFDLTFGLNVFSREDCWEVVEAFVKKTETSFKADQEMKHFEDEGLVRSLTQFAWDHFDNFTNPSIKEFSSLDFKTELANLKLDKTFPTIMSYAAKLPDHHSQSSDLTVSVYQCVLQCFMDEFPNLSTFVHNQKSCHQLLVCHICVKGDSASDEKPQRKKKLTKQRSKSADNCLRDQRVSTQNQRLESQEFVQKLMGQLEESQNLVKELVEETRAMRLKVQEIERDVSDFKNAKDQYNHQEAELSASQNRVKELTDRLRIKRRREVQMNMMFKEQQELIEDLEEALSLASECS